MAPRGGAKDATPSAATRGGKDGPASRGRGGARGGRGGGKPGLKQKIGGETVSWEYDPDLEVDDKPREVYPPVQFPTVAPPTQKEKEQVALFRQFRRHLHEGPLYTVLDPHARIGKLSTQKGRVVNPFEDMPSYTQKYKQEARTLPDFSTKKYCLKLFPEELHDVIEPHRKRRAMTKPKAPPRRPTVNGDEKSKGAEPAKAVVGKGPTREPKNDEVEDEGPDEDEIMDPEEDEAGSEANPDENFSEDDEDMGEDYNAELYFDGGEADDYGADEGGADEGGFE